MSFYYFEVYIIPYNQNYKGKGDNNLTDGLLGSIDNFRDGYWLDEYRGGLHYIATGLNYFPASITNIQYESATHDIINYVEKRFTSHIEDLNKRKEYWNSLAESCPSHYQYLKDNIYHDSE